jgi:hypothetical protein
MPHLKKQRRSYLQQCCLPQCCRQPEGYAPLSPDYDQGGSCLGEDDFPLRPLSSKRDDVGGSCLGDYDLHSYGQDGVGRASSLGAQSTSDLLQLSPFYPLGRDESLSGTPPHFTNLSSPESGESLAKKYQRYEVIHFVQKDQRCQKIQSELYSSLSECLRTHPKSLQSIVLHIEHQYPHLHNLPQSKQIDDVLTILTAPEIILTLSRFGDDAVSKVQSGEVLHADIQGALSGRPVWYMCMVVGEKDSDKSPALVLFRNKSCSLDELGQNDVGELPSESLFCELKALCYDGFSLFFNIFPQSATCDPSSKYSVCYEMKDACASEEGFCSRFLGGCWLWSCLCCCECASECTRSFCTTFCPYGTCDYGCFERFIPHVPGAESREMVPA